MQFSKISKHPESTIINQVVLHAPSDSSASGKANIPSINCNDKLKTLFLCESNRKVTHTQH